MKGSTRAKVGNRKRGPAYRTPARLKHQPRGHTRSKALRGR